MRNSLAAALIAASVLPLAGCDSPAVQTIGQRIERVLGEDDGSTGTADADLPPMPSPEEKEQMLALFRAGAKFNLGDAEPRNVELYKALSSYLNARPGSWGERRAWRQVARLNAEANGGSPVTKTQPNLGPATADSDGRSEATSPPVSRSGDFALKTGYRDWNATVTSLEGVNSTAAKMTGVVTQADVEEYCERTGGSDYGGKSACLAEVLKLERGRTYVTTANCAAGSLSSSWGENFTLTSDGVSRAFWVDQSGEEVDECGQCGTDALNLNMQAMCPNRYQ